MPAVSPYVMDLGVLSDGELNLVGSTSSSPIFHSIPLDDSSDVFGSSCGICSAGTGTGSSPQVSLSLKTVSIINYYYCYCYCYCYYNYYSK
jgi:hypothetical protein